MTQTYGFADTSYRAAGEEAGVIELCQRFYALMDSLPQAKKIRAMHTRPLAESRDRLVAFLCGWLGGPRHYNTRYGSINIPLAHAHLGIDFASRDAWLLCMHQAVDEQPWDEAFKAYFLKQIAVPAERCRTRE